ncbi:hypothetical protein CLAIMM_05871, partial [Cladophialophora immunda]
LVIFRRKFAHWFALCSTQQTSSRTVLRIRGHDQSGIEVLMTYLVNAVSERSKDCELDPPSCGVADSAKAHKMRLLVPRTHNRILGPKRKSWTGQKAASLLRSFRRA